MPINNSNFRFSGTLGGITFYTSQGKNLVKRKNTLTKERMQRDPRFAKTLRNAHEFRKASKLSKEIRIRLRAYFNRTHAPKNSPGLTAALRNCINKHHHTSNQSPATRNPEHSSPRPFHFPPFAIDRLTGLSLIRTHGDHPGYIPDFPWTDPKVTRPHFFATIQISDQAWDTQNAQYHPTHPADHLIHNHHWLEPGQTFPTWKFPTAPPKNTIRLYIIGTDHPDPILYIQHIQLPNQPHHK